MHTKTIAHIHVPMRMIGMQRILGEIRVQATPATIIGHWLWSNAVQNCKTWHSYMYNSMASVLVAWFLCVTTRFPKMHCDMFLRWCLCIWPKFLPTKVGKLWKAINAKQKQILLVCNNVTQTFTSSFEFVVVFTWLNVLPTFGRPCLTAWFVYQQ